MTTLQADRADRIRARSPRHSHVLVVAPHPDDDVIGCGAALARFAARGARVRVVFVTDGAASHPRSRRFPPERVRAIREEEARSALRIAGVRSAPRFLRCPDGAVARLDTAARAYVVHALAAEIGRATTVFAPLRDDPHADHVAVAALVSEAYERARRRPMLARYGVWTPIAAARGLRTGPQLRLNLDVQEVERKRRAIAAHRSQTTALIDDDPDGFRIDAAMLAVWLAPHETFSYDVRAAR